jgi:hypothetical protein
LVTIDQLRFLGASFVEQMTPYVPVLDFSRHESLFRILDKIAANTLSHV